MYFRTIGVLALFLFGLANADPFDINDIGYDMSATGTEVYLNYQKIDFGSFTPPSIPFALETRFNWNGQATGVTHTFWFYGNSTNYIWVGGIWQGPGVASPIYVIVKNGAALNSNPALSYYKPAATVYSVLSVSVTATNVQLVCFGWSTNDGTIKNANSSYSLAFNPPTTGKSFFFGDAPASVQSEIRVQTGGSSWEVIRADIDEIRIFNSTRSYNDVYQDTVSRMITSEPNLFALWTVTEPEGATTITDLIASRIITVPQVKNQTDGAPVFKVDLTLNYSEIALVPVATVGSTGGTYTASRTSSNATISTCYLAYDGKCYPFPVSKPPYSTQTPYPIVFTPLRSSCNTTVSHTFQGSPNSVQTLIITTTYLPFTLIVDQPSVNISTTSASVVQLTGSFGDGYLNTKLDNSLEYVQYTGDALGTTYMDVTINSSGLFIPFAAGYGEGQLTFKMCGQTLTRPVYYPRPSITNIIAFSGSSFEIEGINFGPSRTWITNPPIFVTPGNGTTLDTINCDVSNNTDTSINCTLAQNRAIIQGQSLNITVNIGSIPLRFYYPQFDPCNGLCKNGGQCLGNNICDCNQTFYQGATCEEPLVCLPNCTKHGTCARPLNNTASTDYYCLCDDGYEGKTCSQKVSSGQSTPVALIAGVTVGGGVLILGLAVAVVILLIRSKNQRRGGKNFIPLHKKDFTKIIYGEQLNQDAEKTGADLNKLELMLVEDNLEVAVAVSNITQITEADKIAKALVVIFQGHDKVLTLLQAFIAEEVNTTESAGTLFRSNSMVSKMFKFYSRLIGLPYLYETIGPELCELIEEELGLEVDPEKMEEGTDLDEMRWMLMAQSQKILKSVLNSVERCPPQFRTLFAHIKRCVADRFPENINTTIGGFIFLRFFCPAVSSPEAYGIVEEPPSASARRLLILITKVLQNLSNDVEFGSKEPYMTKMNDFIHSNRQKLTEFYDKLVKPSVKPNVTCTLPKNMKSVSLSVIANHIKDNLSKVENASVKSRLESVFNNSD